jgi:hypothetical protein
VQVPDPVARENTERFIAEYARTHEGRRLAERAAEEAAEDVPTSA